MNANRAGFRKKNQEIDRHPIVHATPFLQPRRRRRSRSASGRRRRGTCAPVPHRYALDNVNEVEGHVHSIALVSTFNNQAVRRTAIRRPTLHSSLHSYNSTPLFSRPVAVLIKRNPETVHPDPERHNKSVTTCPRLRQTAHAPDVIACNEGFHQQMTASPATSW